MQPKLSTLSGPLRASEFPLTTPLTIGCEPSNGICLEDLSVSPRHCQITREGDRFLVTDLDSNTGTFVNGIPIKSRQLSSGDAITIGGSVFLLHAENSQAEPRNALAFDKESAGEHGTGIPHKLQQLRHEEVLYLHPESLAALSQSERLARNLSTLLRISAVIGSLRDVDALQWQLLGMIFDVVPAERGVVLLIEPGSTEIASHVAWDRRLGPDHPVHVSESLVHRVIEQRVSVLDNSEPEQTTPRGDERWSASVSVLCVPLVIADASIGILYLDSSNPAARFTNDDLQLLSAIAGIASIAIENARQFERLGSENEQLRAAINLEHDMIGSSARMREVYQFIERVAPSDATVLIHGESGTGKELVARAIHKNSQRKHQPFVALNCAALTETLLESELFGHEKGSFTSAIAQKKGLLEVAEGGSVFLDEVGELPLVMQAKLLRVLQEREFVRVGGTRSIKLNVRFLAATNRDLQKAIREETFRADLYHRLNVISVSLPALREHSEDIPLLAEHFVARYSKKCSRHVTRISSQARACLLRYEWPGNIRELENAIERAVVIGSSDVILPEDLPDTLLELEAEPASESTGSAKYHDALRNLKKQLILNALEQAGGSFTEAAKSLGVHPNYLHRLIRNLDLRVALKKQTKA